jgi:hypothetical protein
MKLPNRILGVSKLWAKLQLSEAKKNSLNARTTGAGLIGLVRLAYVEFVNHYSNKYSRPAHRDLFRKVLSSYYPPPKQL